MPGKRGLHLVFEDQGPGIADINLAIQDGYSTGGGLGMGMPGAKRLSNEFYVESAPGEGAKVTLSCPGIALELDDYRDLVS